MAHGLDTESAQRLTQFLDQLGGLVGGRPARASFAMYAMGLLSESERKSIEPMAARSCGGAKHAGAEHQRLHHFIADTKWDDHEVRLAAARYAIAAMAERGERPKVWIIDDTGFLKQGKHSVGVQRQYTGSAGKTANCQVAVSLSIATQTQHLPMDFALFLPESWTEDPERRQKAKIPAERTFKTKHELALAMIEQAARDEIPGEILLADSFYGHSQSFRDAVHLMGFDYGMAVYASDRMQLVKSDGSVGEPSTAKEIALALGSKRFQRCTWREGTRHKLSSRFAVCRVKVPAEDSHLPRSEWLLIEWPHGEQAPTGFILTTLPKKMSKKHIVRIVKERYRTEQMYEEMKGELGLDHFEGRSFPGWNHHVSVALCAYAFLVAERSRAFPPSDGRQDQADPLRLAA